MSDDVELTHRAHTSHSLVDSLVEDILELVVSTLHRQPKMHPAVVSLCSCNHQLRRLLPSGLRSWALSRALEHRPTLTDLRADGRLFRLLKGEPGSTNPLMVERMILLQRAMVRGAVKRAMQCRPEPENLVKRNVLKAEPGTQEAWLIQAKHRLERALVKRSLGRWLEGREPTSRRSEDDALDHDAR